MARLNAEGCKCHRNRPKALTVRIERARGPMVERHGAKRCRVSVGQRQHETSKRETINNNNSFVEWRCILVFPYSNEKWLKIEVINDHVLTTSYAIFELNQLEKTASQSYEGSIELDDGTEVDVGLAFYPRPSAPPADRRNNNKIASPSTNLQNEGKPQQKVPENYHYYDEDHNLDQNEIKANEEVEQTIQFFDANTSEELQKISPVMITIGSEGGPINYQFAANPKKLLFEPKGPHTSGVETIWLDMASFQTTNGSKDERPDHNTSRPVWTEVSQTKIVGPPPSTSQPWSPPPMMSSIPYHYLSSNSKILSDQKPQNNQQVVLILPPNQKPACQENLISEGPAWVSPLIDNIEPSSPQGRQGALEKVAPTEQPRPLPVPCPLLRPSPFDPNLSPQPIPQNPLQQQWHHPHEPISSYNHQHLGCSLRDVITWQANRGTTVEQQSCECDKKVWSSTN